MKKFNPYVIFACSAGLAICFLLAGFAPPRGGYSYTIHVNQTLAGEYYITGSHQTPTLSISKTDMNGAIDIRFNECGQLGAARKLSLRASDQKILKEWSFVNNSVKNDAMVFALKDAGAALASGPVGVYYTSERVTKPLLLANLTTATIVKTKALR